MKTYFSIALFLCLLISSCSKNEETTNNQSNNGQLAIKFDPIINDKKLILNESIYTNKSLETFTISMAKFFVSNIQLKTAAGSIYTIPKKDSYFLIDVQDPSSLRINLEVPEHDYTELIFNLGIDSLTNTLPIEERTGILDVSNGMYWGWNSGYIFFKLEGSSPQSNNDNKKIAYHIGLFGGYNSPTVNNNRLVKVDLKPAGTAKVKQNLSADIHLMVDFGKIFDGTHKIAIKDYSTIMTSGPHQKIADNYATMFRHDHTHNYQKISK